ncbi:MAG: hypothetical protein AAF915_19905 [Cyanobacteria bacterium P01_D01_bin.50]
MRIFSPKKFLWVPVKDAQKIQYFQRHQVIPRRYSPLQVYWRCELPQAESSKAPYCLLVEIGFQSK